MTKKLVGAIIVVPAVLGGAAITLTGAGVANAQTQVTVCNRQVLTGAGWVCTEWTTCSIYSDGSYICRDGTRGGPSLTQD